MRRIWGSPSWSGRLEAELDADLKRDNPAMSSESVEMALSALESWQRLFDARRGQPLAVEEETEALIAESVKLRARGVLKFPDAFLPRLRRELLAGPQGRDLERVLAKLRARVAADRLFDRLRTHAGRP